MAIQAKLLFSSLCLANFFNGTFISLLGPMIPVFSTFTGHSKAWYSYIFIVKTVAELTGGILSKFLADKVKLKDIYGWFTYIVAFSYVCLYLSFDDVNIIIWYFAIAVGNIVMSIMGMSVILSVFQEDHPDYWLMVSGFVFGVGTIAGPTLVMLFQERILVILGVTYVGIHQLMLRANFDLAEGIAKQVQKKHKISSTIQFWIASLLFIFIVQELGLASWLPTYSIQKSLANEESSGTYSMIFWTSNTVGRFVWMFIPGTITKRLQFAMGFLVLTTLTSFLLQSAGEYEIVCILAPLTSGFIMANLYVFYVSLPEEYGFHVDAQNAANFSLGVTFGEGILITAIGYGMDIYGPQFLITVQLFCAIASFIFLLMTIRTLKKEQHPCNEILMNDI